LIFRSKPKVKVESAIDIIDPELLISNTRDPSPQFGEDSRSVLCRFGPHAAFVLIECGTSHSRRHSSLQSVARGKSVVREVHKQVHFARR
jgi:hypothetical protein